MKKYVRNMKEYEEIYDILSFIISAHYFIFLGLREIPNFLLGSGTWKNFDLFPSISALRLGKILLTLYRGIYRGARNSSELENSEFF